MHFSFAIGVAAPLFLVGSVGCGSSVPPPRQAIADVQAADRAATELGAERIPNAELHLRLAREQTSTARGLMDDGNNERASEVLSRAKADAELALALTQEAKAQSDARDATNKAKTDLTANGGAR